MEKWEEIKKQIKLETKWYFEPKKIDTDPLVDILKKIFNSPIDSQYKLGGLSTTYTNALFKVIDEDSSKKDRISNFEVLKNVEPFLKKILYFKDFEQFSIVKDELKGLIPILKSCGLNPSNFFLDEKHLEQFTDDQYEYHLIKTYLLRNLESHNCELWSSRELEENIGTELIFYMEAVSRCQDAISVKLFEVKTDYSAYIENEISEFEKWAFRFVATDTVEDFSVFESYAIEHFTSDDENEEDDEITTERAGTVDWIRKNNLPEKRMLLWGDAGLGKSTTLQYLTYLDAKAYREGISNYIPVYIPLGMLIDRNETLESYVFNKLKTSVEEGKKLLESGNINLFLDGVNEIPEDKSSDILSKRIREIQFLIDNYPKSFMIISNRPEKYNQFKNIPVFRLQPMDYVKIMEFIQKNTRNEEVRNLIKEKIKTNQRILNIISTPLMTTRLISIVQEFKEVPESEGMIIRQFLDALYKRERVDKQDVKFDDEKINYLLTSLALYGYKKNGTNSGLTRYEVLKCFSSCLEEFHFEYDTIYALEILIKMGIFNCDSTGEIIVFSHQAYQDYYISRSDNFSLLSEGDVKKKITELQKKRTIIDEKKVINQNQYDYLKFIARDKKYEKSIMYNLQNSSKDERYLGLKVLCKYNIVLAARTISSYSKENDIKLYIEEKAKEQFMKSSVFEKKASSIYACLELEKIETVIDIFSNYINIHHTYDNKLLITILRNCADNKLYKLLVVFTCLRVSESVAKEILNIFIVFIKNKEIKIDCHNENNIAYVVGKLNSIFSHQYSYKLIELYRCFIVPKKDIPKCVFECAKKNISGKHNKNCIDFLSMYDFSFKSKKQIRFLLSNYRHYLPTMKFQFLEYLFYINDYTNTILKKEKNEFIELFNLYPMFSSIVYLSLPPEIQYYVTKTYGCIYYLKTDWYPIKKRINFSTLSKNEFIKQYPYINEALFERYKYSFNPELIWENFKYMENVNIDTFENFLIFRASLVTDFICYVPKKIDIKKVEITTKLDFYPKNGKNCSILNKLEKEILKEEIPTDIEQTINIKINDIFLKFTLLPIEWFLKNVNFRWVIDKIEIISNRLGDYNK